MNMLNRALRLGLFVVPAVFITIPLSRAQWVTEEYHLKAGWNAVYLHIDASHDTLNRMVGADPDNPIEEIWMWTPPGPAIQFYDSVQIPNVGSTEWLRWDRYWSAASPLQRLAGNAACLVRVKDSVPEYTWTLPGRPMPPAQRWTSSGMNFIGFPVARENPPFWGTFLGPARSLHEYTEIYRYVGGPFGAGNPQRLFPAVLRNTRIHRNQAYWVRSEEYNRYFGPFEVELQNPGGIDFGTTRGQHRLRLRNRTDGPLAITATLVASAPPPAGEPVIAGIVPLLLRGDLDLSDLTYGFTRFSEEDGVWALSPAGQPGSEIEVVVGIDRSAMTGSPGDLFAGILRLRDTDGLILIDLPITARFAPSTGLWVGHAIVGEVAHRLVEYALDEHGRPLQTPGGSYVIDTVDESFGPVVRPFPLRLVVHNDDTGHARLLQRVYHGLGQSGEIILSRSEGALDVSALEEARRISVVHLPWSAENVPWSFNGALGEGAEINTVVNLPHNDHATNPFLHSYHPDHDNLDGYFESELPRGVESYDVIREITLRVRAPEGDFAAVTAGSGVLSGIFEETVTLRARGPATRVLRARGGFALNRVSDISTLAD